MSIFLGAIAVLALIDSIVRGFRAFRAKHDERPPAVEAMGTSAEWAIVSGLFFIASVLAAKG